MSLAGLGAASVGLLLRMRRELRSTGTLRGPTVGAMYATYALHAALTARVAYRRSLPVPIAPRLAGASGAGLMLAGAGLWVAGIRRFAGAGQVSGTEVGDLVTRGIYRYSRNPQYLGYVLALAGLGVARRSLAALALAGAMALAFRCWVPVEEHHLDRRLGAAYRRYRERTPRWFALPGSARTASEPSAS